MAKRARKSLVELVRETAAHRERYNLARRRIAARRRRALAPRDPSEAVGQMNGFARRFASHAEALLRRHVLLNVGNPTALANGVAVYGRELDAFASKARPSARGAAAKASKLARTEFERIMKVSLPHAGVKTGAEDFAGATVRAYQKVAADSAELLLQRVFAGDKPPTEATLLQALWLPRNRAKQVAEHEVNDFYSGVFSLWARRAGDEWFIWVTKRDLRVRHKHRQLDGKVFSWREGAPGGIYPGQEPGCRCRALPSTADLA